MAATPHPLPRTVEEIFNDFKGRRAGIVKALTVDFKEFYEQCDPESDEICLYGLPNETWELKQPLLGVPPELPDPSLGINFTRESFPAGERPEEDRAWLTGVAIHCDSWLLSVAFYFVGRFGIGQSDRERLFDMINDYPTVYEEAFKEVKKQAAAHNNGSEPKDEDEEEEDDEEESVQVKVPCGVCGVEKEEHEFWICCDVCVGFFHGECIKIPPAEAEHIDQYKCPVCGNKKFSPQND